MTLAPLISDVICKEKCYGDNAARNVTVASSVCFSNSVTNVCYSVPPFNGCKRSAAQSHTFLEFGAGN